MFFGCSDNVVSQTGFRSQAISEDRPRQIPVAGTCLCLQNSMMIGTWKDRPRHQAGTFVYRWNAASSAEERHFISRSVLTNKLRIGRTVKLIRSNTYIFTLFFNPKTSLSGKQSLPSRTYAYPVKCRILRTFHLILKYRIMQNSAKMLVS